jgi:hypothetical protein
LTSRKDREKYQPLLDKEKQREVERAVTAYIQANFSFVVFRVDDKAQRLEWERKIISTVSNCQECRPSENWLGAYSPKPKIRQSGLWQVNELYKDGLSWAELEALRALLQTDIG